ncbi:hypothetical protein [Alsobacter sp. R-9]
MLIRELQSTDLEAVASLFLSVFRHAAGQSSQELVAYLRTIYLEHPWRRPDHGSMVAVSEDGNIDAFIGVLPVPMIHNEKIVQASVCTALMVDPDASSKMAGPQLLRAYLRRDHELSFTDNAAPVSEAMWQRLKGRVLGAESLYFRLVLRPADYMIDEVRQRLPFPVAAILTSVLPLLRRLTNKNRPSLVLTDPGQWTVDEATDDELIDAIPTLQSHQALRPAWDQTALQWILERAAERKDSGTFRRLIVRDSRGTAVGAALYFVKAKHRAEVLDTFFHPQYVDWLLDALITDAFKQGASRLEGKLQQALILSLGHRGATFRLGSASLVYSSDAEVVRAVESGNARLGGLAGEGWSRLVSDEFVLGEVVEER